MIIEFGFGVIGALLVLANSKLLRNQKVALFAFLASLAIAVLGIYFIFHASKDTDRGIFFPMFTPLTSFVLLQITRFVYRSKTQMEIIIHMHGLIPFRHESRYVTRLEKSITYILLILSVLIPYFILKLLS